MQQLLFVVFSPAAVIYHFLLDLLVDLGLFPALDVFLDRDPHPLSDLELL